MKLKLNCRILFSEFRMLPGSSKYCRISGTSLILSLQRHLIRTASTVLVCGSKTHQLIFNNDVM